MHISEGILSPPVLLVGGVVSLLGVAWGLRHLSPRRLPEVALFTSAFFVASLIHLPLGPSSVHLLLNGLVGLLLGPVVFPAFLVALFLQALLFQFGGLTTLGVNTMNMALPALGVYFIFRPFWRRFPRQAFLWAALAGALAVFASGVLAALELFFSGEGFSTAAKIVLWAHLPLMGLEALVTGIIVRFLQRVRPEILFKEA